MIEDLGPFMIAEGFTPQRAARRLMAHYGIDKHRPAPHPLAAHAFFGGRVQVFRTGRFEGPIYRYDMRSAYPWALSQIDRGWLIMRREWRDIPGLHWEQFREADGRVGYPPSGNGWVWSDIREDDTTVVWNNQPFSYLSDIYALAESDPSGYGDWLKAVMRCTWGNLLLPNSRFYSLEWAGQAAQLVHDHICEAVYGHEDALLVWNIDSVTATEEIPELTLGLEMGQFRLKILPALTIEMPTFGPLRGHPEPGTSRWNNYWPPEDFRDPNAESTPYVYQGPNRHHAYPQGI